MGKFFCCTSSSSEDKRDAYFTAYGGSNTAPQKTDTPHSAAYSGRGSTGGGSDPSYWDLYKGLKKGWDKGTAYGGSSAAASSSSTSTQQAGGNSGVTQKQEGTSYSQLNSSTDQSVRKEGNGAVYSGHGSGRSTGDGGANLLGSSCSNLSGKNKSFDSATTGPSVDPGASDDTTAAGARASATLPSANHECPAEPTSPGTSTDGTSHAPSTQLSSVDASTHSDVQVCTRGGGIPLQI